MIFLGDPAQLRPVAGAAIYDEGDTAYVSRRGLSQSMQQTKKGHTLYNKYLVDNCVFFNQSCSRLYLRSYTREQAG